EIVILSVIIAFLGHSSRHSPQRIHSEESILGGLPVMAPDLHTF
ncbi:unnamed protein product, partial [marine sediment metagenome]